MREAVLAAPGQLGPVLGGVVPLAAGIYQFTPWKQACLRKYRSPPSLPACGTCPAAPLVAAPPLTFFRYFPAKEDVVLSTATTPWL